MIYLRICGSFKSPKILYRQIANSQIKKILGPQIANRHIFGKFRFSANLPIYNFWSYLRTAYLWVHPCSLCGPLDWGMGSDRSPPPLPPEPLSCPSSQPFILSYWGADLLVARASQSFGGHPRKCSRTWHNFPYVYTWCTGLNSNGSRRIHGLWP